MPAPMYCAREEVAPVRAWSKSLVARSRAAGGREEALLGGWAVLVASEEEEVEGSALFEVFWGRPMLV